MTTVSIQVYNNFTQILTGDAVVLEWAEGIFGVWSTLFSLLVALSALSSTVVASGFCGMRQLVCVAREGKSQLGFSLSLCIQGISVMSSLWKFLRAV